MSFGFSVSDVIVLSQLAWRFYINCKGSSESFRNISLEVLSLHAVLQELGENLHGQTLQHSLQVGLERVARGCQVVLKDLQGLLDKHEGLGTRRKRLWNRVGWGLKDVKGLRSRLISNTTLLTAFISTSQITVQDKLDELLHEYKRGNRTSILTNRSKDLTTTNGKGIWHAIQKELEEIGVTVAALEVNKNFIMDWLKTAIVNGSIEDKESGIVSGSDTLQEIPFREENPSQQTLSRKDSRQALINSKVAAPHIRQPFRSTYISYPLAASNDLLITPTPSAPRWC